MATLGNKYKYEIINVFDEIVHILLIKQSVLHVKLHQLNMYII